MSRSFGLGPIVIVIAAAGMLACGEDGGEPQNPTNSQQSSLVAKEVSDVTRQAGVEAGADVGKNTLDVAGSALSGAIQGAAGAVNVSGSVSQSGNAWKIDATLAFNGYKGATGLTLSGNLTVSYTLDLDISDPLNPKVKFTASVKGQLTVNGAQTATVDLTVSYDASGGVTCGGNVAGHSIGAACNVAGGPPPTNDAGVPKPDGSQPGPAPSCNAALDQAACGGALSGKYIYKEACATDAVLAPLKQSCPGLTASNIKTTDTGGTLNFTWPTYVLNAHTTVSYDASFPASCAVIGCKTLEAAASAALSALGAATVTCSGGAAGGCSCKVRYTVTMASAGPITTAGGLATLSGGEQYWYCVKDGGLQYMGKANTGDVGVAYSLSKAQ